MEPRRHSWHSLSIRITLLVLLVFLVAVLALSLIATRLLQGDMERHLGERQFATATLIAAQIEREIAVRRQDLEAIATRASRATFADPSELQRFLEEHPAVSGKFSVGLFAVERGGRSIAFVPYGPERIGVDYADRDYIQTALREGKVSIGRPVTGRLVQAPVFVMATPVRNEHGDVIGAIAGSTSLAQASFIDDVTRSPLGHGDNFLLVDRRHRVIVAASDKSRVMELLPTAGDNEAVDRFMAGYEGHAVFVNGKGIEVLTAHRNVAGTDWYVATATPTAEAFAPIRQQQERMLWIAAALTLPLAALTAWLLRRQLQPLASTVLALRRRATADQAPAPLPVVRPDEIGELVAEFNRLLATLARRESELRESEERYRLTFETSTDAINITRAADGLLIDVNQAFLERLGYERAEVIGRSVLDLGIWADPAQRRRLTDELRQHGRCANFEARFRSRDGGLLWGAIAASLMTLDGDQCILSIVRDIADVKAARDELEENRNLLAERVASRTAELARAKQAAEAANEAKSRFLANMSHEIRTPLNAIVGMTALLRRSGVSDDQAARLAKIDEAADHLLGMISGILDLSRIEAGKLELDDHPVDLGVLLGRIAGILGDQARAKQLDLQIDCEDPGIALRGDPTRLQQALLNYVANAIKFTEHGSVTLRALISNRTSEHVEVRFEVRDTGVGIADEARRRLFALFEQADNSATRKYGGSGLGLAITRRLAEAMGGEAGCESTPGVGSLFWFSAWLTIDRETAPRPAPPRAGAAPADVRIRERHAGRHVLVVDDDEMNRIVAQTLLEEAGLQVDTAADGAEAVACAERAAYALILMDLQMPRLDGFEACIRIRRLPAHRTTPIIAVTANAFAEDRARCLATGLDDFVIKPYDPDSLYDCLEHWLDHHVAPAELA